MDVEVFGAFHAKGSEKIQVDVRIIHKVPNTTANIVLKGVAEDRATLVLSGTIVVEKGAEKTQSFLKENILLLSPSTHAEAVPNLEIYADDVKCSHAATVSAIPEEHLFYLMSRGLARGQAERMIVNGFLSR